ncbi:hypothetical protein EOA27_24150 [Mesorhizobium sp. M2A.F.Ca.ET.037.01.1.1]|uniref:hypothetical protein n=1 Tax=unclassified Mesorhizobium TaxID=325217 RepID=UPI000F764365|nr:MULTISPECIES: hypothetical protein [unclassified Mesorhizobium]RUY02770.1 hypothetical protein EOA25_20950 [Mesorhizobium sp. M2A.F.Ca.ET.040.01.1.1]RVC61727.1 hypothetical protein EN759_28785 [Mesorhizobium sp. M00.F.Ca.ET.038.03.1.1]RVC74818.1 hypothetical protein EN766_17475 [Mesorhizobium sp. M2A.F.Ca.ET.046.02.1.1]AZO37832.1 hypothetical protein EJ072_27835 [Mesorhizobium sp. M2A.F.Ca.ET.046.03.2.1]RUX09702.1 hypothetical protein EOA27_24150 [Mesorhizobium sp. M2A.F.Ca.ET.037.01.1.1]
MVFIVLLLSGMAPSEASRHASIILFVFRFTSSYFMFLGTNDPETGGIRAKRAFGSGSRGGEAGAGSPSFPCRPRRALTVIAGLAARRWRRTSPPGEAETLPSVKSSHSGPRTVLDNTT